MNGRRNPLARRPIGSSDNGRQSAISRKMNDQPAIGHFHGAVAQQPKCIASCESRIAIRALCVLLFSTKAYSGARCANRHARYSQCASTERDVTTVFIPRLSPPCPEAVTVMACSSGSLPPSSQVMPFPCASLLWTPIKRRYRPTSELERTSTLRQSKRTHPQTFLFCFCTHLQPRSQDQVPLAIVPASLV